MKQFRYRKRCGPGFVTIFFQTTTLQYFSYYTDLLLHNCGVDAVLQEKTPNSYLWPRRFGYKQTFIYELQS